MRELEDFEPTDGHRHDCKGRATGCQCAAELYAVAAELDRERYNQGGLTERLLEGREDLVELYDKSPAFHHSLSYLAWMLPYMVAGLAEPARRNDEWRELLTGLMQKANKASADQELQRPPTDTGWLETEK